jgi:hypothetical protein
MVVFQATIMSIVKLNYDLNQLKDLFVLKI